MASYLTDKLTAHMYLGHYRMTGSYTMESRTDNILQGYYEIHQEEEQLPPTAVISRIMEAVQAQKEQDVLDGKSGPVRRSLATRVLLAMFGFATRMVRAIFRRAMAAAYYLGRIAVRQVVRMILIPLAGAVVSFLGLPATIAIGVGSLLVWIAYKTNIFGKPRAVSEVLPSVVLPDYPSRAVTPPPYSPEHTVSRPGIGEAPAPETYLGDSEADLSSISLADEKYIRKKSSTNITNLNPGVRTHLLAMAREYYSLTGKKVHVTSAYRSTAQQQVLWERYGRDTKRVAPPGRSLHEHGLALDIDSRIADELERLGLMKKYGFTRPVGREPWHLEPAGIQRNISKAREDRAWATQAVAESLGRGGGGIGAIRGGAKGRSRKIAMEAWNAEPVHPPTLQDRPQALASAASVPTTQVQEAGGQSHVLQDGPRQRGELINYKGRIVEMPA